LCELLAQHYNTVWCPEFAREYLLTNGKEYEFEDLETIAKGQLAMEDEFAVSGSNQWCMVEQELYVNKYSLITARHPPVLFIDTDMYVMKVWCEYVFSKCHQFILEEITHRKYDLYLLCNIDLPWVKDELREYPDEGPRKELYQIYTDILLNQNVPWVEIRGNYDARLQQAIDAIDNVLAVGG
jgi:nicotinamide riboside kinase